MFFNTISVIGLGYIGLPTAAMLASKEKMVIGVDIDQRKVNVVNSGKINFVEPKLHEIVSQVVERKFLRATVSVEPADAFIIAVPTPLLTPDPVTHTPYPNISYVKAASIALAKVLKPGDLVILESTVPVGTTEQMASWLAEERQDLSFPHTHGDDSDVRIAYCPERVIPGRVVLELTENDRIIGGMSNKCSAAAGDLYKIFVNGECIFTNSRTAELSKLTENASRDVGVAFANELSIICDQLDIDVRDLIRLANRHPRVNILQPGCGVGGHCIAVDPWFIVSQNPDISKMIQTARQVNEYKPLWVIDKIKEAMKSYASSRGLRDHNEVSVACYGLTFKPDIDDLRQSPALQIAQTLGALYPGKVYAVEPYIDTYDGSEFELVDSHTAICKADIHIFLVKHTQFKNLELESRPHLDICGVFCVDSDQL